MKITGNESEQTIIDGITRDDLIEVAEKASIKVPKQKNISNRLRRLFLNDTVLRRILRETVL